MDHPSAVEPALVADDRRATEHRSFAVVDGWFGTAVHGLDWASDLVVSFSVD